VNTKPKETIVLGAIQAGIKKFNKIHEITQIEPEELNSILEQLENNGFIIVIEKNGFLGRKIEIRVTEKGSKEVDNQVHELQTKWNQMSVFYKTEDREKLKQYMDDNKSFFPMMIFFGVMNMMMFSMMFSMIGTTMSNYVPPENMPGEEDRDMGERKFDTDVEF
jgi:DNA-binding HxlR family transcriptional regulator